MSLNIYYKIQINIPNRAPKNFNHFKQSILSAYVKQLDSEYTSGEGLKKMKPRDVKFD